ncbi:paraquat-inducible protein A, partial [Acinetobacter baumannii]|nr:paraquat-inducible protein A [Acinetobacter baumannii]
TALILFVVSNAYPIVEMDLQGVRTQTTLWGAVQALHADNMTLVALLVFATTIVFPLTEMLMMAYLLVPLMRGNVPPGFERIMR